MVLRIRDEPSLELLRRAIQDLQSREEHTRERGTYSGYTLLYIRYFSFARVYPVSIRAVGPRSYDVACFGCGRSKRIFYHARFSDGGGPRFLCSVCNWRKANRTMLMACALRLWPAELNLECQMRIACFVCSEGWFTYKDTEECVSIITTAAMEIVEMAHQYTWHAILLTGYRRACRLMITGHGGWYNVH